MSANKTTQCITLLRASAAASKVRVRVYSRILRNYSYAYLELRKSLESARFDWSEQRPFRNAAPVGIKILYRKIGALRRLGSSLARNYIGNNNSWRTNKMIT